MSEVYDNLVELVKFRIATGSQDEEIDKALQLSLSAFNMVPHVTYFTFDDEENIDQLTDVLVSYASYILLHNKASKAVGNDKDATQIMTLAHETWNNWDSQVNNLKQSDSFYEDFVKE